MLCDTRTEYDWKELKIDNLPPDILTGDYEISEKINGMNNGRLVRHDPILNVLDIALNKLGCANQFYYKTKENKEPKQPTHDEIMSKWWKKDGRGWQRVVRYFSGSHISYYFDNERVSKDFFDGRESADIPPEN